MYNFKVKYRICNSNKDLYHNGNDIHGTGFMSVFGSNEESFNEPSFDTRMFFHDTFEHMLEGSELFRTSELSVLGEAVALGIRGYLFETSNLVDQFAGFNKIKGVHANSFAILFEYLTYPDSDYPILETFYKLDEWEENIDPIPCERHILSPVSTKAIRILRKAYNYGMWLAEHKLYDQRRIEKVSQFMLNYVEFVNIVGLNGLDTYDTFYPSKFQGTITVSVANEIEAVWTNREGKEMLIVSSDTEVNKVECIYNFCKAIGAEAEIKIE